MPKAKLPSTPRGRRRLLRLADLLVANARNKKGARFDYGDWGSVEEPDQKPGLNCGTTACALGLAAISGRFKGLIYDLPKDCYGINIGLAGDSRFNPKKYSDHIGAGAKYFDITYNESYHIFGGCIDVGDDATGAKAERAVAKAIRKFVKGKYKPLQEDDESQRDHDISY